MSVTPGVAKSSARGFALRILKLGISCCYFLLEWGRQRILPGRANKAGTCVVLYYHSVPRAYRQRFAEQIAIIAQRGVAIDLYSLNHLPAGQRSISVTFDDALESFADNAVPVLTEYNVPATVFVVTDRLGTKPDFGDSYYAPEERIMSAEQLRNLPALVSVGSHTLTHPNLTELSTHAAETEITQSRKKLESLLQRPIRWLCFPYGAFNESTITQCRRAGYERVFTTGASLILGNADHFAMGRVEADPWDWRLEFRLKILGAYCWQPWLRALKRKIPEKKPLQDARPERAQAGAKPVDIA